MFCLTLLTYTEEGTSNILRPEFPGPCFHLTHLEHVNNRCKQQGVTAIHLWVRTNKPLTVSSAKIFFY